MGMKRRGGEPSPPINNRRDMRRSLTQEESFAEQGRKFLTSSSSSSLSSAVLDDECHNDRYNYALLIALYTLQGIPMGLSASIPFLIQQKVKSMAAATAAAAGSTVVMEAAASGGGGVATATKLSYNANAIFALCSWPFSLKLLWAPIVDACFVSKFGRRKTWLVPIQLLAGTIMVLGSNFVETELGLTGSHVDSLNVKGVTMFFFVLYFCMATQDIAVDGWALTMLSKKNRSRGPVCNSIGQNLGYFLSFVGFLALNDVEASETLWRPLLRLSSNPKQGLVSLGGFIRSMGYFMLVVTTYVALFKRELPNNKNCEPESNGNNNNNNNNNKTKRQQQQASNDDELDAAQLGLRETYHRLWAVCQLPAVQMLFVILLTYRLPTCLSDNVKFLKAVELGLSKSTTALLSPTVILPLGILVPLVASKTWHGHPLRQFMTAYKLRVTLVPVLDVCMLHLISRNERGIKFWMALVASTAMQAICNSLQFNAQMTFFASKVDPAIGGSYMTLLNTAANLGGTWPSSLTLWLVGKLSFVENSYNALQGLYSCLGILWIFVLGSKVRYVSELPDDAWRTHLLDQEQTIDVESSLNNNNKWTTRRKDSKLE